MDVEKHIKESVLDQDHLADTLKGYESSSNIIKSRIIELVKTDQIQIYKYIDGRLLTLSKENAIAVLSDNKNCVWNQDKKVTNFYLQLNIQMVAMFMVHNKQLTTRSKPHGKNRPAWTPQTARRRLTYRYAFKTTIRKWL